MKLEQIEKMYEEVYNGNKNTDDNRSYKFEEYYDTITSTINLIPADVETKRNLREGLMMVLTSACIESQNDQNLLNEMKQYRAYIQYGSKFK